MQGGARCEHSKRSAEGTNAYGEELRDLLDAGLAIAIDGKGGVKEWKRMRCPDLERFNHVERISESPLEDRIHARHEKRVCANTRRHGKVTPALGAVVLLEEDSADWNFDRFCSKQSANGLDRMAS